MSNTWGRKVKITIFGESHGVGIGAVIDGLPVGEAIDLQQVQLQLARRAPGNSALATPRKEADALEVLSGLFEGHTTGAPICGVIRNTNTRSKDYTPQLPRPGHADLAAYLKYNGFSDYRGGGHFSGRITAGLVAGGAMAMQILARRGIAIGAHIAQIENIKDDTFNQITSSLLQGLTESDFPLLNPQVQSAMTRAVLQAKQQQDSVGGIIECAVCGVPAGLGAPFFESLESRMASKMFSVPAVKGVEFGAGFGMASMRGSTANDDIILQNGKFATATNNNGGINGGITNGMPIVVRAAVKPTPSISQPQTTVDLTTRTETALTVTGRHDPCIIPRAVCVIEAAVALCILDAMETDL
ncbi:MAG: chorismate synthase [Oscillospiraceae bacterium]|nr:chorismate synthase [Oscillospiraceae bacterium]